MTVQTDPQPPEPYFDEGGITIYHGDALDVMGGLKPGCVDLVLTSPPYNMGITPGGNGRGMYGHTTQHASRFTTEGYDGYSDAMDPDDYEEFLQALLELSAMVATEAIYVVHRPRIIHKRLKFPFDLDFDRLAEATEDRCFLHQIVILDDGQSTGTNVSHYSARAEWMLVFAWGENYALASQSASGMGDVWRVSPAKKRLNGHPCPFSEDIPYRVLTTTGATSVLDPCMGSGTTLAVAKRLGVRAIGIDQSEAFCAEAAERCGGPIRDTAGAFEFSGGSDRV